MNFSQRRRYWIVVFTVLFAATSLVGCGPKVTVPDVRGQTQSAAQSTITGAGLEVGTVTERYSNTVDEGKVISQSPSAGAKVERSSNVNLVVSKGPEPVPDVMVPDVTGLTQSAAETEIANAGLTVGVVIEEFSDTVAEGDVISQNPAAGERVSEGSSVDLVISQGLEPATVPDVVGMSQEDAQNALESVGLAVGDVTQEYSDAVAEGDVISQDPAAGVSVPVGTSVDFVISEGPAPVTVPNLAGMTEEEAASACAMVDLELGARIAEYSDTVDDGTVISQEPQAETLVEPGSLVSVVISVGTAPEEPVGDSLTPEQVALADATESVSIDWDKVVLEGGYYLTDYPEREDGKTVFPKVPMAPEERQRQLVAAMLNRARTMCERSNWQYPDEGPLKPAQNGLAYLWGGKYPELRWRCTYCGRFIHGVDCSGFVYQCATAAGINIPVGRARDQEKVDTWNQVIPDEWGITMEYVDDAAPLESGDIIGWETHIGIIVKDESGVLYVTQSNGMPAGPPAAVDPEQCTLNLGLKRGPRRVLYSDISSWRFERVPIFLRLTPVLPIVTISPLRSVYGVGEQVTESGSRFTPNGTYILEFKKNGVVVATPQGTADASGQWSQLWKFPAGDEGKWEYRAKDDTTNQWSNMVAYTVGSVRVLSPNGGERWPMGTARTVQWTSKNLNADVKIQVYKGDVSNQANVVHTVLSVANTGSCSVTLPGTLAAGSDYRVAVAGMDPYHPVYDFSDGAFTVTVDSPTLSVSPDTQFVASDSGCTDFVVSNTGTGTLNWTATVISGNDWLTITSGASGTNAGTITACYTQNAGTTSRTGVIRVETTLGGLDDALITQEAASDQPPTILAFGINGGAAEATSRSVTLNSVCSNDPVEYLASESPVLTGASWLPYSSSATFELSAGNGTKMVYFQVRNSSGESAIVSDEIVLNEGGGILQETILLPGDVPLEMVWIEPGTFMMGRYPGEQDSYDSEDPQHEVTIGYGFWMAKYELTKAQWIAVMGTEPWLGEWGVLDDPDSPAVYVSWNHAQAFITALNTYTGKTFRLPSEAEWEYACRAGTTTRFYWGDDPDYTAIGDYAWWDGNADYVGQDYAHVVGQKLPNAWGLYDMSGNVLEWCEDDWHSNYVGAPADGSAWVDSPRGDGGQWRGGSWRSYGGSCRSADRTGDSLTDTWDYLGFRLSRSAGETIAPDLSVNTNVVNLNESSPSASITLSNAGGGTLSWTATSSDPTVTVTPPSYTGNSVLVTISASDFSDTYTAQVTFTNNADGSDYEVVSVFVSDSIEETIMLPGNVPLEMVWIEPGTFMMGRYPGEQDSYDDEDPQHEVTLSQGFWMGKYELTKRQWKAVMGTEPWFEQERVLDDPDSPAVYVSWYDTNDFIAYLNDLTGMNFRLPTEAEWEYACRAGTTTRFYWGDDPTYSVGDDYCWWTYNAFSIGEQYAHVVGQKEPNAWGLYDMVGNVSEWCEDIYDPDFYSEQAVTDPCNTFFTNDFPLRTIRGGSLNVDGSNCRSARRRGTYDYVTHFYDGFRVACADGSAIALSTDNIHLSKSMPSATITVSSTDAGPLHWITTSNDARVTVNPSTFMGNSTPVTLTASDLTESYTAEVTFTNTGNSTDYKILSVFVVDGYVIQPGPEGKDTFYGTVYVQEGGPDKSVMYSGGWADAYYNYFEFDLTSCPSSAETLTVEFCIYHIEPIEPYDPEFQIFRITEPWEEAGVTSASNPASTFYKDFGPFVSRWNYVDITDLYKAWKEGVYSNFGIKLVPTNTWHTNGSIASSDHTNASIRPMLIIRKTDS